MEKGKFKSWSKNGKEWFSCETKIPLAVYYKHMTSYVGNIRQVVNDATAVRILNFSHISSGSASPMTTFICLLTSLHAG